MTLFVRLIHPFTIKNTSFLNNSSKKSNANKIFIPIFVTIQPL